jgi:hypothetical protein
VHLNGSLFLGKKGKGLKLGMTHGRADLQVYGVNIREKIEEERKKGSWTCYGYPRGIQRRTCAV